MLNALLAVAALAGPADMADPASNGANEPTAPTVTAFKAKRVYLGDGRSLDDGIVIVTDGVITSVGMGLEVPAGASVVEHDGAISPGLIALHSKDGAGAELFDSTRITLPEADAAHAFRPDSHDFVRARHAGITSVVLAPDSQSLVGGTSVVVKTSGGVIVKRDAHLALGTSGDALNGNKFPTSYDGAMRELVRLFSEPEGNIGKAASGNLAVLMPVNNRAETLRAIEFSGRFGLKGALYGSYWAEDVVPAIKESGLAVICDPIDVGDNGRGVRSIKALTEAGIKLGFGLDAPDRHPESLRFGAAACVRAGVDPHVARRSLFGDAADIAGAGARIGRLERGRDADLVLWSGDPIQLSSAVKAVYIDGERVVGGEK